MVEHLLSADHLAVAQENLDFHPMEIDGLIQQTVQYLEQTAREKDITLSVETILPVTLHHASYRLSTPPSVWCLLIWSKFRSN
ncbi:MAG: hypothetical protein WCK35_14710 [Chloroflexota bacterium]